VAESHPDEHLARPGLRAKAVKSTARKTRWLYTLEGAATVVALFFAGCSTTAVPVKGLTPPAYSTISVQPFVPVRSEAKKAHVVTASRYDRRLAGNCTSNGERYDPKSLTAASRSLPLGSTVKVTNVDNGRSANVRINDRGPYVRGRSLDLSDRAAENIGLGDRGLARVKITRQTAAASVTPSPCE
jgi:peptidoglycan lytic transglycosylase